MATRALLLIFIIGLSLAFAANVQNVKVGSNDIACDKAKLKNLEKCCDTPKLLPLITANQCQKQNEEADKKRGDSQKAACLVECIMKNRTQVTSSGEFRWDFITEEFTFSPSNTWTQIIKDSILVCKARMEKWGKKPEAGKCDARPGKFMSCMGRNLAKRCPKSSRLDTDGQKYGCDKIFAHLDECSVFATTTTAAPAKN